ncbi:MAG: EAL domain-containing protein [Chloroflexi bacterium]|nr:EAL domain-containing protein [Chloroflexota bacterium]
MRYVSPTVGRVLGYQPEELVGHDLFAFIHQDDAPWARNAFFELLSQPGDRPCVEFRLRHRDGSYRFIEAVGSNLLDQPSVGGIVVNARDITERKTFEQQLARQAFYDPLTGLPNRALFTNRLEHALTQADRRQDGVAVLFVDLDRFKVINDTLGHAAGDQLLTALGPRFEACLRAGDTVARFGGDEFTILLEGVTGIDDATGVAQRIMAQFHAPFTLDGHEAFVSASIGVALSTPGTGRTADLLRDADVALYRAKAEGRAHHVVFDTSMNAFSVERLNLETDLRRAVERGELELHYQPEVDLNSGRIVGLEALVRWAHPQRGLVPPAEFIPLAEENGQILGIGRWVLEQACRQMRCWHTQQSHCPPPIISVNLSGRQFQLPDLVGQVAAILQETGLAPSFLKLEITESVLVEDAESTISRLLALKQLGIRLAIDDFGTGYSSLSYLRRLPVDTLKIDRSFIGGAGTDERNWSIVRAVSSLAHSLGMDVTAEGIESLEILALVRAANCDRGQGYYFSKPLTSAAVDQLLAAGCLCGLRDAIHAA